MNCRTENEGRKPETLFLKIKYMKTIRLAIRSLLHSKMYSGVNMAGLALSLVCVITISRYVHEELTVDRFNKKLDRIYITTWERSSNPGRVEMLGIQNYTRETTFVDLREHPGVETYSQFIWRDKDEIEVNDQKFNATVLIADSNFLKITDYPVTSGIHQLSEPHGALITQQFAQKIFGDQNPVGKTLRHTSGEIVTITGVIGNTSTKSTLTFDVVLSYHLVDNWSRLPQTLVLLHPNVNYRTLNKQYEDFFESRYMSDQIRYQLFPLSDIYFSKDIVTFIYNQGNYNYVNVLMAVGILILLAGIINFVNIYTVIILRRGKELGIKRVFGAGGYTIFLQLLTENLLATGIALLLALLITSAVNPFITHILQFGQIPSVRFDLILSFGLLLILPIITTLYPFIRFHYAKPVTSLKNVDSIKGKGSVLHILLSFQYIITITLIIVSLFFIKQLQYMLNIDPGYRTENIIKVNFIKQQIDQRSQVSAEESRTIREREDQVADEIIQKMNACPLITQWTYGQSPNKYSGRGSVPFKLSEGEFIPIHLTGVSESWLRLFEIPLLEGRLWDDATDNGYRDYNLIITESVLKLYGITDFNEALLQPESRLWYSSLGGDMSANPPYRIVGVVKDFNFLHLSKIPTPTAFSYANKYSDGSSRYDPIIAAIVPGRTQDAIAFMKKLHEETVGGEFTYSFVADEIREMYREDKKIATIYAIFTFIAIFISALGLFSMSLYDIQQHRKEIAIRKINGASFTDIIRLLLKKYFITFVISFVIASPVALFAINRYLEGFANKAPISWWLFAVAVILTAGISLLTLFYQTRKAAIQNPAEVVKSE